MAEHRCRVDKVLDRAFLVGPTDWPLDELRRCHADCLEIETEVSYVRRVARARLDILEAELERQSSAERRALHAVIDRLEADLAERHKVGQAERADMRPPITLSA